MAALRSDLRIRCLIHLVFLSFWNPSSDAAAIITKKQPLAHWDRLFSPNRIFMTGFTKTSTSMRLSLGIWVANDTEQQHVWNANTEDPILGPLPSLIINDSGNLIISSEIDYIPVTNVTWTTSRNSTSAKLLDNGNLVLVDEESRVLWQSFDHPTVALLPGMKLRNLTSRLTDDLPFPGPFTLGINPNGSNQIVIWFRDVVYWKSRVWNSSEDVEVRTYDHRQPNNMTYRFDTDEDGKYFSYSVNQTVDGWNHTYKWVMTSSGQISVSEWLRGRFEEIFKMPPERCWQPFAIDDGGCTRRAWPNCTDGGQNFFRNQTTINFNKFDSDSSMGLTDCEFTCRNNCYCVAYATFSIVGTGCLFRYEGVELLSEENYNGHGFFRDRRNPLPNNMNPTEKSRWRLWLIIMLPVSFIMILLEILRWHLQRTNVQREENDARELPVMELFTSRNGAKLSDIGKKGLELPLFSFSNVLAATDNFSAVNKLGEGGFGPVYKGKLLNEQDVAVKRLSRSSGQGLEEFKNEVSLISKLQHNNLVKLIGMCVHGEEKILIYEYMPNKSLDFFLFDQTKRDILDWGKRVHIIDGIAQGLLYLHKYSRLKIIHRDLKASNILLDGDMNPKISDFGMARMFSANQSEANTNRVVGTYGYMSPEYAMEGLFSVKSDVFSFGVLLLEIITSKKNTSFYHFDHSLNLLGYAWELWNEGRGIELIDPVLVDSSPAAELTRYIHVALLCVQERATDRPTMSEVISFLNNQNAAMLSPKQPAFFLGRNAPTASLPTTEARPCSLNDVTVSTMGGR